MSSFASSREIVFDSVSDNEVTLDPIVRTRLRLFLALLALLLIATPLAAAGKRRAVGSPGGPGNGCRFGVIDANALSARLIAVDATDVYYLDDADRAVFRVPKRGGARTELARFEDFFVLALAIDDTTVYVAGIPDGFDVTPLPGSLFAIPKIGGAYRTLVSGITLPYDLAVDETHVYWPAFGTMNFDREDILSDGKIERVRKDGTGRQTLAEGLSAPGSIVLDDASVYFGEFGLAVGNPSKGVRRVAKSGGAVTHPDDQYVAVTLAMSDTHIVYYGGTADGSRIGLLRVAKSGGAAEWLVEDADIAGGPEVFEGQVYYIAVRDEVQDTFMKVPVGGGTAQVLTLADTSDYDFAIDSCGVYFGTWDGPLMLTPR